MIFGFANELSHGAHGAVHTPGPRLKQNHGKKAEDCGSKHDAVKAKGKLGRSF